MALDLAVAEVVERTLDPLIDDRRLFASEALRIRCLFSASARPDLDRVNIAGAGSCQ